MIGYFKGFCTRTLKKSFVFLLLFSAVYGSVTLMSILIRFLWRGIPTSALSASSFILAMLIYEPLSEVVIGVTRRIFFEKKKDYAQKIQELTDQFAYGHHSDRVAEAMMDYLTREMELQWAAVYLKNPDDNHFILNSCWGGVPFRTLESQEPFLNVLRRVRKPVVLRPFDGFGLNRGEERIVIRKAGVAAAVPFFLEENIHGVLLLGRKKSEDAFSREEEALLETVMEKISMFFLSSVLLKEAARSSLELGQRLKMAALRNLARGVHHEVRNPLHALSLFAGATLEEIQSQRWDNLLPEDLIRQIHSRLEAMLSEIARIRDSLGRFAQFARPDKQEVPFALRLDEEIHKFLALMKDGHKLDDIRVNAQILESCKVLATPGILQTALFNLFNNAMEAMKGHGEIDLAIASETDGFVKISMRDNGPGIPPEILPHIFDEYFTTKSDSEAAGIGLSMLRHQIEKVGGRVEAFSVPGQGAEFIIHFRRA